MLLIDKENLFERLDHMSEIKIDQLQKVIERMPKMEIVRCVDCTHSRWACRLCAGGKTGTMLWCYKHEHKVEKNAFCSHGERSEE